MCLNTVLGVMEISLKHRVWHQACSVILKKKRKINWDIEGKWLNVLPNSDFCNRIRYAVQEMFCFLLKPDFFETVPLSQKVFFFFFSLWINAQYHPFTPSHATIFSLPCIFYEYLPRSHILQPFPYLLSCSKLWSFWPSTIDNCWDHAVAFPWTRNH